MPAVAVGPATDRFRRHPRRCSTDPEVRRGRRRIPWPRRWRRVRGSRGRPGEPQVVGEGSGKEHRSLRQPGDPLPPLIGAFRRDAVDGDVPFRRFGEAEEREQRGGLTAAVGAGERSDLAGSAHRVEPVRGVSVAARDTQPSNTNSGAGSRLGSVRARTAAGAGRGATVAALSRIANALSAAAIPSSAAWNLLPTVRSGW